MTTWDVTALGEGGLRLSTPPGELLERSATLDVAVAGAEANVLAGLAALGWRTAWASVLPDTPPGRRVERELRANAVSTTLVRHVPEGRVGVYFVEYGALPRPTVVHFDRANTAFSQITSDQVDWDRLLDTRVLHLTGITAAISDAARVVVLEACQRARTAGVAVSFDVNYRARMWAVDEARGPLLDLVDQADIVFIRQGDAEVLLGTATADETLDAVRERSAARHIAVTDGDRGAVAWIEGTRHAADAVDVDIIDRLGAGDAFAAGFLDGTLREDSADTLRSATLLAAMSLAQRGEQVVITRAELERRLDNPKTGLDR